MKKFYRIFAIGKVSEAKPELSVLIWHEHSLQTAFVAVSRDDAKNILQLPLNHACVDSDGDYWIRFE